MAKLELETTIVGEKTARRKVDEDRRQRQWIWRCAVQAAVVVMTAAAMAMRAAEQEAGQGQ
jgi:hypothetical protein